MLLGSSPEEAIPGRLEALLQALLAQARKLEILNLAFGRRRRIDLAALSSLG